jgi:uncharacterized protein (DUF3820 family)
MNGMVNMKRIDTIEQWHTLAQSLKQNGYAFWQSQYLYYMPDGFHAWFWKTGFPDEEIVTFNKDVQHAILHFNYKK